MRQRRLIPSGAQCWNRGTLAADGSRVAFCSTLAVYIYSLPSYRLEKLIAAHDRTITAMCWSPHDSDLMVTSSVDGRLCLWRISSEDRLATVSAGQATALAWSPHEPSTVAVATSDGKLLRWDTSQRPVGTAVKLFNLPKRSDKQSGANTTALLRWNARASEVLAMGLADGVVAVWLGSRRASSKLDLLALPGAKGSEVVAVEWDPLSEQYLLAAYRSGTIALWDIDEGRLVHTMAKQAPGLRGLAWLPQQPGNFVTISSRVGVARVWNVSQRDAPLELVRLGARGLNDIYMLPDKPMALMSFTDGAVGVFDFSLKKLAFSTLPGHQETVFDAEFRPCDSDCLATGSYDGTVKLWHTPTMECKMTLGGGDGIIYGVAWAPEDDDARLAAVTNLGVLVVWDTVRNEQLLAVTQHGSAIYRVDWNPLNPALVSTGSQDGTCCITDVTQGGRVVFRFQHPAAVFGCDWDPRDPTRLLTGCHDGQVRLFVVGQQVPLRTFSGHRARVFNVCWSPLQTGVFASGSDDQSVRVWSEDDVAPPKILSGHMHNVRALAWLPELTHVLLSGSWDSTIRVWDTRTGTCTRVLYGHSADVYALAVHPARPFRVVSTSRDTSTRFWSMTELVSLTLTVALATTGEDALAELHGSGSRQLAAKLRACAEEDDVERMRLLFTFFYSGQAIVDLWDLVRACADQKHGRGESAGTQARRRQLQADFSDLNVDTSRRVVHASEVVGLVRAQAQMLESVRMRKFGTGGVAGMRREEQLAKAAATYLKVGNVVKYCDVMVELEQWEAALAMAPAAGMRYWRQLARRYADHLAQRHDEAAAGVLVAVNEVPAAVSFLADRGQLQDAFLVASADHGDKYAKIRAHVRAPPPEAAEERKANDDDGQLLDVSRRMADRLYERGEPVAAAACHLAVGDATLAVHTLMQANEVEQAYALVVTLGVREGADAVVGALARRFEKHGMFDSALRLLRGVRNSSARIEALCARAAAAVVDVDDLFQLAGLQPPPFYAQEASQTTLPGARLRLLVLGGSHTAAATEGCDLLDSLLGADEWDVAALRSAVGWLHSVDAEGLDQTLRARLLARLLVVAAHEAIWRGYYPVVPGLLHGAKRLGATEGHSFPVSLASLSLTEASFMEHYSLQACKNALENIAPPPGGEASLTREERAELERLRRVVLMPYPVVADGTGNVVVVEGGRLPTGGNRRSPQISVVSREPIQGPEYILEDGVSAVSLAEAVMWHEVCPFSPMMTGARLYP